MRAKAKLLALSILTSFIGALGLPLAASAASTPAFGLKPFTFVGTAEQCGGTAGTKIVTAKWDKTTGNTAPSILLQKNGPTANCSSAGVDIMTSLEGGHLNALTELNFDYKDGGHCGAGSPRFNVQTDHGTAFLGCAGGTSTSLSNGWTQVEFTSSQLSAAYTAAGITDPATATLEDVYIIFDEGIDTPIGGTIGTAGTVIIDNISVNNHEVGSPTRNPKKNDECKKNGWKNFGYFKNQGDCVSFMASKGKNLPSGPSL